MIKKIAISIIVLPMLLASISAAEEQLSTHVLTGYWEVQGMTVNGKEDRGEAGAYWIFRQNGTFKIVKRGRKPEGKWTSTSNSRLTLEVGGRNMLDGKFRTDNGNLFIEAKQGSAILVFRFRKRVLAVEPTEPKI